MVPAAGPIVISPSIAARLVERIRRGTVPASAALAEHDLTDRDREILVESGRGQEVELDVHQLSELALREVADADGDDVAICEVPLVDALSID